MVILSITGGATKDTVDGGLYGVLWSSSNGFVLDGLAGIFTFCAVMFLISVGLVIHTVCGRYALSFDNLFNFIFTRKKTRIGGLWFVVFMTVKTGCHNAKNY